LAALVKPADVKFISRVCMAPMPVPLNAPRLLRYDGFGEEVL
jgi:hypothetical protein